MALKHGYIRLSPRGPSEAEQRAALVAAGVSPERVHVDGDKKRARDAGQHPARANAIRCCRRGDVLVVATPGRLGTSREDIRATIGRIAAAGAMVQAAGGEPFGGVQIGALVVFEAAGHHEVERERTAPARKANRMRGEASRKSLCGKLREEVTAMWRDADNHTSQACEMKAGMSRRTLYKLLGGRIVQGE